MSLDRTAGISDLTVRPAWAYRAVFAEPRPGSL
jgi:hypothetical protein